MSYFLTQVLGHTHMHIYSRKHTWHTCYLFNPQYKHTLPLIIARMALFHYYKNDLQERLSFFIGADQNLTVAINEDKLL